MRITIIKNDDFTTIGLFIETTNPGHFTPERIFSWGLGLTESRFSKTVRGDYFEKEVVALIKAQMEYDAARNLMMTMTRTIEDAGIKVVKNNDNSWSVGKSDYYDAIEEAAKVKLDRAVAHLEEAIRNHAKNV